MKKEVKDYILGYFRGLMTREEAIGMKHAHFSIKLEGYPNTATARKLYLKNGWITEDENLLESIADYEQFEFKTAERILREHPETVFFNNCPKCGKLARTPQARQCRYCGEDWH